MIQCYLFISGSVQGVGYRQFVKSNARKLGLTGWVKNLQDGRVEAIVQGDRENIEKLIVICRKGPFLSEVKEVNIKWETVDQQFSDFVII